MNNGKLVSRFVLSPKSFTLHWLILRNVTLPLTVCRIAFRAYR
jgi:hypothetical protein